MNLLQEFKEGNPIPEILEGVIVDISKTGVTCYPWPLLKELIVTKMVLVLNEYNQKTPHNNFDQEKTRLSEMLRQFPEAPFTLQRITELLLGKTSAITGSGKNFKYMTSSAFTFALEKVLSVSSTQLPLTQENYTKLVQENAKRMQELIRNDESIRNNKKRTSSDMELGTPKKALQRTPTPINLEGALSLSLPKQVESAPDSPRPVGLSPSPVSVATESAVQEDADHGSREKKRAGEQPTVSLPENSDLMEVVKPEL
uniref:Uncharacterized protein n=1 Tax=Arcella intermedia TaxID=1963864 RepID=A0A6B2LEP6_9EUKA